MIAILIGVIGFIAGASVVYFATRAKSKSFNSPGYVMLRRELFPKRGQNNTYSSPKQDYFSGCREENQSESKKEESQKLPDWF